MEAKEILMYSFIAILLFDKYAGIAVLIALSVFKFLGWV